MKNASLHLKQKQRQLVKQVHAETLQAAVKAARSAADDEGPAAMHEPEERSMQRCLPERESFSLPSALFTSLSTVGGRGDRDKVRTYTTTYRGSLWFRPAKRFDLLFLIWQETL